MLPLYPPLASKDTDPEDYLNGAPDLVIEVLSHSNTAAEIYDKEKLCLENGAQEFWVVDPDRRQVKVSTPDGRTVTYPSGQAIPLPLFGEVTLPVSDIFYLKAWGLKAWARVPMSRSATARSNPH